MTYWVKMTRYVYGLARLKSVNKRLNVKKNEQRIDIEKKKNFKEKFSKKWEIFLIEKYPWFVIPTKL